MTQDPTQRMREILERHKSTFVDPESDVFGTDQALAELSRLMDESRLDELLSVCEESVFDYQYKDFWKDGAACLPQSWLNDRIATLQQPNKSEETGE